MRVRILEKIYHHTNNPTLSTPFRRQREVHWMRILGTAFPNGCNDNINNLGNLTSPLTNNVNVKLIRYKFWCTRCAFLLIKSCQWCSGLKVGNLKKEKKLERADKTKTVCHEIAPNLSKDKAMHEGDNLLFWDEFIKLTFFFTVEFIFVY
jgi:hypothetical protein